MTRAVDVLLYRRFLRLDHKPRVDTEYVTKAVKDQLEVDKTDNKDNIEPPAKKIKLKGRNKNRPKGKRVDASEKLCPAIVHEHACSYGDKCKFNHDKAAFMANKPADIADHCYLFDTYGKCDFGITCRFARCHLSENFDNLQKENFTSDKPRAETIKNVLKKDLQVSLWKKKYDFSRSNSVLDEICPEANKYLKAKDKSAEMKRNQTKVESQSNIINNFNIENQSHENDSHVKTDDKIVKSESENNGLNSCNHSTESVKNENNNIDTIKPGPALNGNRDLKEVVNVKVGDGLPEKVENESVSLKVDDEGVIGLRPQEKKIVSNIIC